MLLQVVFARPIAGLEEIDKARRYHIGTMEGIAAMDVDPEFSSSS
jgi:hypothetical protein